MTTHEYHQLLKFLYFEGYAETYEEAEYMIEEMSDNDFDSLCEEVFPQYTQEEVEILDYLISEGFADTNDNALVILENMSEEWANEIVEMRKEDKVKGKQKTPMYLTKVSKKAEKTPEGKWKVKKTEYKKPNPDASIGRMRQGMTASPEDAPAPSGFGSERETLRRHPHGGGGSGARGGKPGEARGVKKTPGAKQTERNWNTDGPSPAMKVGWAKAKRSANAGGLSYKRGF